MEPRAANKLLKASPEIKHRYIATFEAMGKVPSQRDFATKHRYDANDAGGCGDERFPGKLPSTEVVSDVEIVVVDVDSTNTSTAQLLREQHLTPTTSSREAKQRIKQANIRLIDLCGALEDMLRKQDTASEAAQDISKGLRHQINHLLFTATR